MNPEVSLARLFVIAAVVLLLACLAAAVFTGVFDVLLNGLVNFIT
jgi:hypothetical protein